MNKNIGFLFCLMGGVLMTGCADFYEKDPIATERLRESPQYSEDHQKFRNNANTDPMSLSKLWKVTKDYFNSRGTEAVPNSHIALKPLNLDDFSENAPQALRFARLGHSTLLIQLGGKNWLTDPVFSSRASPVQWAGPKRFHKPPIEIEQLPAIEGVIISHNHYDHLDYHSIQKLSAAVNYFIVPLGIGQTLKDWGVKPSKIVELDWWEKKKIGDVELIATPSQHFSGRGLFDSDKTLWSSWVIRDSKQSAYFSGDSGYFPGFKEIGDAYGPFDLAFMECGAYNELWRDIHMMPEDTLQAFVDVKGKHLVPIHNGTFNLSTHAWFDPMERITDLTRKNNIEVLLPVMGETVSYSETMTDKQKPWW
ncbi:MAG: MBL fold metallo-hydrolase [Endozoicomonas sp.]|uniref:MBL fold metallo-hydrolase n=1 Tax=Endozoicomonas sp. TaxID=1892382 RepID=UPI003D9B0975